MRAHLWLQAAGYVTWLVSGMPMLASVVRGTVPAPIAVAWAVAFAAFGLAFATSCRVHGRGAAAARMALLGVQAASGLVMAHTTRDGLAAGTLVVVAAQLLDAFHAPGAIAWIVAQTALLMASFWARFGIEAAWTVGGAFAAFETFALATASLTHSERAAREGLSRAHAELVAARALLAEDSRVAERLRISRDLHDTIGHHLTALSLQLEVAVRLSSGQAAAHVEQAHAVTRLLLSDVRDVVSRLREASRVNLAEAMRTLAAGASSLDVHLDVADPLRLEDPAQAHALLRCVQEIITNATRHGGARSLWIRIERRDEGIDLHARDDGRGAADLKWGNGLTGMRERFEEHAGRVEFTPGDGRGFEVHGFMPSAGKRFVIRIVVVDDQTLVRQGIRSLLELSGDVTVVAEASDGEEALVVIRRERPDVVLLDVRMLKKSGIEVLRELQAAGDAPPTILLTTFDDDEVLLAGVKAGARGYLLKDVSLEQLTGAVRTVAAGGTVIRPAVTERVLRGLEHVRRDFDALSPPDPLTKREVEVLRLLAGGYSNREIAEALGTAEGTVKNHASSILSKLGVRDRTRAVLKALELGYI